MRLCRRAAVGVRDCADADFVQTFFQFLRFVRVISTKRRYERFHVPVAYLGASRKPKNGSLSQPPMVLVVMPTC